MGYRTETRTETTSYEAVVGATCDNCGKELEPVEPHEWEQGALHALSILLGGYYGGYFDCDDDPRAIICAECANKLAREFPFVRKAIDSTLPF